MIATVGVSGFFGRMSRTPSLKLTGGFAPSAVVRSTRLASVAFALLASFFFSASAIAQQDWAQWMGPGRDNVWTVSGIIDKFPDGGPKVFWRTPIAGGYSGPAVANGRVYVTDYLTSDNVKVDNFQRSEFSGLERVWCLDEATGKEL